MIECSKESHVDANVISGRSERTSRVAEVQSIVSCPEKHNTGGLVAGGQAGGRRHAGYTAGRTKDGCGPGGAFFACIRFVQAHSVTRREPAHPCAPPVPSPLSPRSPTFLYPVTFSMKVSLVSDPHSSAADY